MGVNTLAGYGLVFSHNRRVGSNTYQANPYTIKKGYASNIGFNDVVQSGAGGNQGYVTLAPDNAAAVLGVFVNVVPYFDATLQYMGYGLNGSYSVNSNPTTDVGCLLIDDPDAVFRVQMSGGPFTQAMRGQNIGWKAGSNGAPNASGISTLVLDATTISESATLPFRIVGVTGIPGTVQDPGNTNPTILVCMNTAENLNSAGL